jgi:hypothetical protein
MIQLDIDALNARLFDNMDILELQLLVENQPDEDIDETRVWTRWIINPGVSEETALGANYRVVQYGTVTLQVFTPKGLYTGPGGDIRDEFNKLFRGWRSEDKKLIIDNLKSQSSTYTKNGQEFHLINAMASWRSTRTSTNT